MDWVSNTGERAVAVRVRRRMRMRMDEDECCIRYSKDVFAATPSLSNGSFVPASLNAFALLRPCQLTSTFPSFLPVDHASLAGCRLVPGTKAAAKSQVQSLASTPKT